MSFPTLSVREITEKIKAAEKILIIGHTNPDGDALGSTAALADVACALGKTVSVTTPERPAARLSSIVHKSWTELAAGDEKNFDLVCAVDVASPGQLGRLSHLADEGKIDVMIDHHASGTPFAPCLVDPAASASGEIIYKIYRESGVGTIASAARELYAAIISDTGTFRYSNTTPETHRIAAELVDEINSTPGAKTDEICYELFVKQTPTDLKATELASKKLGFSDDGRIGYVIFTRGELDAAGLTDGDVSGAVDVPRSMDGVLIALAIRQSADDKGLYKVSSRSNCKANVAEICAALGGGGHAKAAGCSVRAESPEEAVKIALREFGKALREKH